MIKARCSNYFYRIIATIWPKYFQLNQFNIFLVGDSKNFPYLQQRLIIV